MKIQIFWDVTAYYALVIGKWHGIPEDLNLEPWIIFTEQSKIALHYIHLKMKQMYMHP